MEFSCQFADIDLSWVMSVDVGTKSISWLHQNSSDLPPL
jgi:hypothetical protein